MMIPLLPKIWIAGFVETRVSWRSHGIRLKRTGVFSYATFPICAWLPAKVIK